MPPGGLPTPKSPLSPLNLAVALTSVPVSCAISPARYCENAVAMKVARKDMA